VASRFEQTLGFISLRDSSAFAIDAWTDPLADDTLQTAAGR
jgi:hypothetical protein